MSQFFNIKYGNCFKALFVANIYLNSNFSVPCIDRMMLDKYEERDETQTSVYREVSRKQHALHFAKGMSWQCKVQRQTCKKTMYYFRENHFKSRKKFKFNLLKNKVQEITSLLLLLKIYLVFLNYMHRYLIRRSSKFERQSV